MSGPNARRIVLLGKSGAGKSSLANTMFGKNLFTVGESANSETKRCEAKTDSVNGREITFIDTPGFFDTDRSEEEMRSEIVRCITESSPGPHAFLLVLKVERYTEQEKAVVSKICQYFSEDVLKYTTVLFTHGDQLPEGQTIQHFVRQNKVLSDLVEKCGGRCHVFDNKYWANNPEGDYRSNRFQVEELLKTIDRTVEENQGGCYTNEMLQVVEEAIQINAERIRQSAGSTTEGEIRQQAKGSVFKRFMIRAAGVATGTLLGALLGVSAMVVGVFAVLSCGPNLQGALQATTGLTFGQAAAAGGAAAGGAVARGAAAGGPTGPPVAMIVTCAAAVAGAVYGGYKGYKAAEGAKTLGEAAKKTKDDLIQTGVDAVVCGKDKVKFLTN